MSERDDVGAREFMKHIVYVVVFIVVVAGIVHVLLWVGWAKNPVEDGIQFVSGTEYFPGQEGQVALIIVKSDGNVVTFAYGCNHTILYPNKTLFQQGNYTMNTSLGTYFTNFTVPDVEGVFEYQSACVKDSGESEQTVIGSKMVAGKSFHVTRKKLQAVTPK